MTDLGRGPIRVGRLISIVLGLIASMAIVVPAIVAAQPVALSDRGNSTPSLANHYIVVLKDSVDHPGAVAEGQVEQRGGDLGFVYRHAIKGYSAKLSKGAVEALRNNPKVAYVERDAYGETASQATPTGIDRIFATENKRLDVDGEDDIRADVDIAILDSGIDADHPDLNVVSHVTCSEVPECTVGGVDGNGHGTHVAGTAAAIDNGFGVVGVAPGARLWGVKVISDDGLGELSEYIAGIDWVTDHADQIEVANSSLIYWKSPTSDQAFSEAVEASIDAGVVHVFAAGNDSDPVEFIPGNNPEAITVSALADYEGLPGGWKSEKDSLAGFSNYGPLIDVAAPGFWIYSTLPDNSYGNKMGTSMAAPHVAGAAAILAMRSNPDSAEDVEEIRDTIVEKGNFFWNDTSSDGIQEPLLDLSDESVFAISPPVATTKPPTGITTTTASLNATINPNGGATTYQFEYGTTTAYGSKAPASPKSIGSGYEDVSVSEKLEGLTEGTTYHYRVVATGEFGAIYGKDQTFKTEVPHWLQEGADLPAETSITAEGPLKVSTGSGGGSWIVECGVKAKATLKPGSTGQLTEFSVPSLGSCILGGFLKDQGCTITSLTANSLPWATNATEKSGVRAIKAEAVSLTYKFSGNAFWCQQITVTGTLTATPDKAGEISSLAISGTLQGANNPSASGTLAVSPAGKYGMG